MRRAERPAAVVRATVRSRLPPRTRRRSSRRDGTRREATLRRRPRQPLRECAGRRRERRGRPRARRRTRRARTSARTFRTPRGAARSLRVDAAVIPAIGPARRRPTSKQRAPRQARRQRRASAVSPVRCRRRTLRGRATKCSGAKPWSLRVTVQDLPERPGGDEACERLVLVNRLLRDVSSETDEQEAACGRRRSGDEEPLAGGQWLAASASRSMSMRMRDQRSRPSRRARRRARRRTARRASRLASGSLERTSRSARRDPADLQTAARLRGGARRGRACAVSR